MIAMRLVEMHLDHHAIDVVEQSSCALEHGHLMSFRVDLEKARPLDLGGGEDLVEPRDRLVTVFLPSIG
jgi:hypothetical protein